MQDDVTDATRWAIEQGHVDPRRICIAGASYGGYATLVGLAREPGLYRCGVAWVAVSEIDLLYSSVWSDMSDTYKDYGMPVLIGDRKADAAQLAANSPVNLAPGIRQPVLLAYGANDVRVPIVHGERMRDALAPHNKQVEWLVYPDEGHGWAHTDNEVDFWTRVEAFLARELAPR
jgi:dipeptidyl aminopeptidase/acylaminoacyl peptidase